MNSKITWRNTFAWPEMDKKHIKRYLQVIELEEQGKTNFEIAEVVYPNKKGKEIVDIENKIRMVRQDKESFRKIITDMESGKLNFRSENFFTMRYKNGYPNKHTGF